VRRREDKEREGRKEGGLWKKRARSGIDPKRVVECGCSPGMVGLADYVPESKLAIRQFLIARVILRSTLYCIVPRTFYCRYVHDRCVKHILAISLSRNITRSSVGNDIRNITRSFTCMLSVFALSKNRIYVVVTACSVLSQSITWR